MAVEIPLTRGLVTLVDEADAEWLSQWKWRAISGKRKIYAGRWELGETNTTRKLLLLHRELLRPSAGMVVDHTNGNTLDNTRINIRIATYSQNNSNRNFTRRNATGFRGVFMRPGRDGYFAKITVNGREILGGRFATPEEAHDAYRALARLHFGEFASPI